jgi:hypothetical protein
VRRLAGRKSRRRSCRRRGRTLAIAAHTGCNDPGDDRHGSLHEEAGADGCPAPRDDTAAAPEELRQRAWERNGCERAERRRLHAQRLPPAEDEGLDGRYRDADRVGDLGVRTPFELTHDERCPLVERQTSESPQNTCDVRPVGFGKRELLDMILERHFFHTPTCPCVSRPGDVVRDLDQPVLRLLDLDPALVGAVRVEEGRLSDVFRVGRIPQQRERVVVDVFDVAAVQGLESLIPS